MLTDEAEPSTAAPCCRAQPFFFSHGSHMGLSQVTQGEHEVLQGLCWDRGEEVGLVLVPVQPL